MNKSINPSIPPPPTRPNPFVSGTKDCRGAVRGGAPKFRTVGGGGNRRWREETVETETEWKRQTAGRVSVRSCAVVEKALRASVLSGGVSSPPSSQHSVRPRRPPSVKLTPKPPPMPPIPPRCGFLMQDERYPLPFLTVERKSRKSNSMN